MWPPEALEFLRELEDNNDRDWFKANRARYDEYLVTPGRALAERLGHLGEARLFRPYNDARFHARPPIKEQLGIATARPAGTTSSCRSTGCSSEPGCTTPRPTSCSASARRSTTAAAPRASSARWPRPRRPGSS